MNTKVFWSVIGQYNDATLRIQIILFILLAGSIIAAFKYKKYMLPKIMLGICCIYMSIVFFLVYGEKPIQYFFAAPLFGLSGILFLYDSFKNKCDKMKKFNKSGIILVILVALYPVVSFLLGNRFPMITLYIMPCPLISLAIVIYSQYEKKNKLLYILLTIWALTGIKSLIFNVLEDMILLTCGVYSLYNLIKKE